MSVARLMQQAAAGSAGAGPEPSGWTDPDLGNASYDSVSFSVAGQETSTRGLFFSPDGLSVYTIGLVNDQVHQYSLSSAWDVSSASFVRSFSVSSQEDQSTGLFFKTDGTKMYVIGAVGDDVNEYALSTAWDISSASYTQNFSISAKDSAPQDVTFSEDGLYFYITGASDSIHSYIMSTAWDISTASFDATFSVSSEDASPNGLFVAPDGFSIFMVGSVTDAVYRYTMSTAFDLSTASYSSSSFSVSAQEGSASALFFKSDGSKMYVVGTGNNTIYQYSTAAAAPAEWTDPDLGNASYDSVSFSVAGQESIPIGLFFKQDGTKMYVSGPSSDAVFQYSLSTAYDVGTASYDSVSFSASSQDLSVAGVYFKPDGTKMYLVGYTGDSVYQYSLSTSWDLSTSSYDSISYSVASQASTPFGLWFKPDGTKMFVSDSGSDAVKEYSLSAAWDISTASYQASFSVASQETSPYGLQFNPNGDKMYIVGITSDAVYEYDLSTAWDISTASYNSVSFSVSAQAPTPVSMRFRSDGRKLYISDANDTIYQYSTA